MYVFDIVVYIRKVGLSQAPLRNLINTNKYKKVLTFKPV